MNDKLRKLNSILIKLLLLFLCVLFYSEPSIGQTSESDFSYVPSEEKVRKLQFLYLNRPTRSEMFTSLNEKEAKVIPQHFNYLRMLREKGLLILAGPNLDNTFGIVVFFAESEEEARVIMENDPAIKENIMTAELHPFRVSLMYDFETYGGKN